MCGVYIYYIPIDMYILFKTVIICDPVVGRFLHYIYECEKTFKWCVMRT